MHMAQIDADKAKSADEIQMAQIVQKCQAHAQVNTDATSNLPPPNRDAKSPKLPDFVDEKDELDSYLLPLERYPENA